MPLLSRARLAGIRENQFTVVNVYRVGVIQPRTTIVGLRSYGTSADDTVNKQEAENEIEADKMKTKGIQHIDRRLTKVEETLIRVEKDIACLHVTVTKVDEGMKRIDTWMKWLLSLFIGTDKE